MDGQSLRHQKPDGRVEGHAAVAAAHPYTLAALVPRVALHRGLPVDDAVALGIDRGIGYRRSQVDAVLRYGNILAGIERIEQARGHRGGHPAATEGAAQGDDLAHPVGKLPRQFPGEDTPQAVPHQRHRALVALRQKLDALLQALQHPLTGPQVAAQAPAVHRVVQAADETAHGRVVTVIPHETRQYHDRVAIAPGRNPGQALATDVEGNDLDDGPVGLGQGQQCVGRRHVGLRRCILQRRDPAIQSSLSSHPGLLAQSDLLAQA